MTDSDPVKKHLPRDAAAMYVNGNEENGICEMVLVAELGDCCVKYEES